MRLRRLHALVAAAVTLSLAIPAFATIRSEGDPLPSLGASVPGDPMLPDAISTPSPRAKAFLPPLGAPPLSGTAIECFNYNSNITYAAGQFIPPDPHCAVGPDHVINIGNVVIEWRPKVGIVDTPQFIDDLKGFFSALPGPPPGAGTTLGTTCFDPKVIYDQYAQRFVVVALEQWDTGAGRPSNESRILVAVSKTSDPNAGWWLHSINSKINIGGVDRWADYPGLGVDDKAVYVALNMFAFSAGGGGSGGVRCWIINKTPTYAGPNNSIAFTVHDPYTAGGSVAVTTQPAHMYGPLGNGSTGKPLGTFLVSYSGLTDGTFEYLQVVEITDPLGTMGAPVFTQQFILDGDIENSLVGLPDAPQFGSAYTIETNDRRALNAVWRENNLWTCAEIYPVTGPDANQVTARWWRMNTTNPTITIADAGNVGGEDLGAGTYTFFPAVMVDCDLNMALGFAASNSAMYCGAYYTTRMATDAAGTVSATGTLAAGVDYYKRFFSGTRNRWGDYSGLALCPSGESNFYVYNEYAGTRGNGTVGSQGAEDGRWQTKLGWFRVKLPTAAGDTPIVSTRLAQNVPNPFNPTTTIRFTLAASGRATVAVYDATGAHIRTLVDEMRTAGGHDVQWDGRDSQGRSLGSGVYFYRLTAGDRTESKKMVLLK
jgi:hypothetical protein